MQQILNQLRDDYALAVELRDFKAANAIDLEIEEIKIRQQLRRALFAAYELLTDPNAEPQDADRITALIKQTLEETSP